MTEENKNVEGKIERELDKKIEGFFESSKFGRIIGALVVGLVNLAVLIIINRYIHYLYIDDPEVKYPLLTSQMDGVLPFIYASLILQIVGQIFVILINKYLVGQIIKMILDAASLIVMVVLIISFPFDFSNLHNTSISFLTSTIGYAVLGGGILVASIGLIVTFVKIISYLIKRSKV